MKKGMSILLTFVLVIGMAFSFSIPVYATSNLWTNFRGHSSGTVSVSTSSYFYSEIFDVEQYLTGYAGSVSGGFSFHTDYVCRYVWSLYTVYPAGYYNQLTDFQVRLSNLALSVGSFPSSSDLYFTQCYFAIGSDADVVSGDFPYVAVFRENANATLSSINFRASSNAIYRLFFIADFFVNSLPSLSFPSVTYSFDSIDFSLYGSTYSIEDAINGVNSTLQNQTNSINNTITQQTQQQTDSLENGYDNSGMNSSNDQLSDSLTEYDQAESQITDQAHSYIQDINLSAPTYASGILSAISFSASFLQSLFVNMGDFNLVIVLALTLTFVSMLIGWFRFRK